MYSTTKLIKVNCLGIQNHANTDRACMRVLLLVGGTIAILNLIMTLMSTC